MNIKYQFKFPESMGGESVVMQEIDAENMIYLLDAFGNKPGRMSDELVKKSLVELNGKQLLGIEKEKAYAALTSKKRNLLAQAVAKFSTPTEEEEEVFFQSIQTVVD